MAKAHIAEISPAVAAVTGVVLELTMEEALFINILMDRVGGAMTSSRKHAASINKALHSADVAYHLSGDKGELTKKGSLFYAIDPNKAKIDIYFSNDLED